MAEWYKALKWERIPFAPSEFKSQQSPIFFTQHKSCFIELYKAKFGNNPLCYNLASESTAEKETFRIRLTIH